MKSFSRRSHSY
ncbi:hypothetical protein Pint_12143 [Pistacia integerrima]|uniref:Uncharacterized protein n=1 Tax=Pistacia integerrima TaxID=434235 RepID=A0ACC0XGX8_9ROSI|nr:hypothetical protein Pint_12143 [Pistacia integerrima]